MNKPCTVALGTAALSLLTASPASASVVRDTQSLTGEVAVCDTHTYVLDGDISTVFHDSVDAQGMEHVTGTATFVGVTAVDEHGATYAVHGTQWFGGSTTPNGGVETFTFHVNIVRPGAGVVDSIRAMAHVGPGGLVEMDMSTCED